MLTAKGLTNQVLRRLGLEVRQWSPPTRSKLQQLFDLYDVEVVFDVGANVGQSAKALRREGFCGKIVSFEPVSHLFDQLSSAARGDPLWITEKVALGERPGSAKIHVSGGHGGASSLLRMTQECLNNAPDQLEISSEVVEVDTLAAALSRHYPMGHNAFVKLDVQGFERRVLEGGAAELARLVGMKVEMSLIENYVGETLAADMIPYLYGLGFRLVHIEVCWQNLRTYEAYQVDGLLFRTERANATK